MLKLVEEKPEYARDLPCGISVYVGFSKREQAWSWSVTGEDVDESGYAEDFGQARAHALKCARGLLNMSMRMLRFK